MKLSEAIERYLHAKRDNGLIYETEAGILFAFRRYVNDRLIEEVTPEQVLEFLNIRQCSDGRWMTKHSCLRMFFEFWTDRGHMDALTMPQPKRTDRDRVAAPCIYTRTELRKLIQATHETQTNGLCGVTGTTFRMFLLTLYGTGAMVSEILQLRRHDLDLQRNLIFLRGNGKILPRGVPLNKYLREELSNFLHSKECREAAASANVFVSKRGEPLRLRSIARTFARLRTRSSVIHVDAGMRRPQLCDLRSTFGVHRIASWIKEGADLNRMLPALSAYMGLSDLCSTQRLLRMTPERFKRELDELSPHKARKHWREDSGLMKFLAGL